MRLLKMSKYKCDKCGLESEMIPKEHGNFVNVYNTNNEPVGHKICTGTFVVYTEGVKDE